MKKIYVGSLMFFATILSVPANCVMIPMELSERVEASQLIVEGVVQSKTSYWNSDKSMIFTSNGITISKIYKGSELISNSSISLITTGGLVGNTAIKVDPELELETGDIGIFLLIYKNGEWVSESGPQGFIKMDKHNATSSDIFFTYPAFSIQNKIQDLTRLPVKDINSLLTKITLSSKRAAPVINSISPNTITAGTSSVLTIRGNNFMSSQDTNSVQYKDADNGGSGYIKALKNDYIFWDDTMIKLIVRTKAGTGKIRVVAGSNGVTVSNDTLKVKYAHSNVVRGDTTGYETREIGMNNSNGITWQMNTRFFDSTAAKGAFIRSLEKWRCGTYINWDTLGVLNHSSIKLDGINICAWDSNSNMPSGVLGQCFSYWSGCFTPGLKWYVNELDIRFRVKPTSTTNWNYTSGQPKSTEFHFETVATHELGHGHQLGHVIDNGAVMHYAIANGQRTVGLSSNDIDAGDYVINKSSSSVCGKNGHDKLNSGNCAIVAPLANFTMNKNDICKNEFIVFSDSSLGNISAYAWDFGTGASPANANTVGPHMVQYSNGGNKTISLTITTINGNLVKNNNIFVRNDAIMKANFNAVASEKGKISFTNLSNNSTIDRWYFGDGDSSLLMSPNHVYSSGGTYNVTLFSTNTCNTDDTIIPVKMAWLNFGINKISACISEKVLYIDSSDNLVSTYDWTFNGGSPPNASGKGPHLVSYSSSGNKSTKLKINVSGAADQEYTINNIVNILTDTFSRADFNFGYYGKNIVGFENLSTGSNLSYKWYFGDGDSSTEKNPIHIYFNANNQMVNLKIIGNCGSSDTTITLRDFTKINKLLIDNSLQLYPNPSNEFFTISSNYNESFQVELFDMNGKLIHHSIIKNGDKIDIRLLNRGIYLVKAVFKDGIRTGILQINQ